MTSADNAIATAGARSEATAPSRRKLQLLRYSRTMLFGSLIATAILGFFAGLIVDAGGRNPPIGENSQPQSMQLCIGSTLALQELKLPPTPDILRGALEHCYALIRSQGLLRDFATRELNFIQQYRANGVLMWMIVAITVLGVFLAGLQLLASYELARSHTRSLETDSELTLARGRLVLKSSITGLFILLLSFAFFSVFVVYVYRFERLDDQGPKGSQVLLLPNGGLGAVAAGDSKAAVK